MTVFSQLRREPPDEQQAKRNAPWRDLLDVCSIPATKRLLIRDLPDFTALSAFFLFQLCTQDRNAAQRSLNSGGSR